MKLHFNNKEIMFVLPQKEEGEKEGEELNLLINLIVLINYEYRNL